MALLNCVSWNVNGIRACLKKGFAESMQALNADFIGLQELKCQEETLPDMGLSYPYQFFNYAEKKGYSGTGILARYEPIEVYYDVPDHAGEGRLIAAEYDNYYFVTSYIPNSKDGLQRLDYRTQEWEPAMRGYLSELSEKKPVIFCGDLNVAHQEIDLARPQSNHRSAGFTDEEREQFGLLLDAGFVDTYRHLYPDAKDVYSWWSYRMRARERNVGWRIDYFVVSEVLRANIKEAEVHMDIHGSDHCPVSLQIEMEL